MIERRATEVSIMNTFSFKTFKRWGDIGKLSLAMIYSGEFKLIVVSDAQVFSRPWASRLTRVKKQPLILNLEIESTPTQTTMQQKVDNFCGKNTQI